MSHSPHPPSRPKTASRKSGVGSNIVNAAQDLNNSMQEQEKEARKLIEHLQVAQESITRKSTAEAALANAFRMKGDCRSLMGFIREYCSNFTEPINTSINLEERIQLHSASANCNSLLEQTLQAIELRDRFLFGIAAGIVRRYGKYPAFDFGVAGADATPCFNVLVVYKIFQDIIQIFQDTEAITGTEDIGNKLEDLHAAVTRLERENAKLRNDQKMLQMRADAVTSESGRQLALVRLQQAVTSLEYEKLELTKSLEACKAELKDTQQSTNILRDQLLLSKTEYDNLLSIYESEVVNLRPQMEKVLVDIQQSQRTMQTLRTDIQLSTTRFAASDTRLQNMESDLLYYQNKNKAYRTDIAALQETLTNVQNEISRYEKLAADAEEARVQQESIAAEAVAACHQYQCEIENLQERVKYQNTELSTQSRMLQELQGSLEEYKYKDVVNSGKIDGLTAKLAAQELVLVELREKIKEVKNSGISPEKQAEWDAREKYLQKIEEQFNKTKYQLKKSTALITQLQNQLDALKRAQER